MNLTTNPDLSAAGSLRASFHEERRLEALFGELARQALTREQRYKMAVLAWLQTTTVDCVADFLGRVASASKSQRDLDASARTDAEALFAAGWPHVLDVLAQGARQRAQVYTELEKRGTTRLRELHEYLVAHAMAQIDFARLEAAGQHERSLDSVLGLLEVPSVFARPDATNSEFRVDR